MDKPKTKKTITSFVTPNKPDNELLKKVVRGGGWVFALRGFSQLLNFVRLIILARILSPSDFGLMGIALLVMSILEAFSQTGVQHALIQKKDDIKEYLNTAWTVLILRGTILYTILYFIAPYVAIFFKTPEAKTIVQIIGFSILFQALTNIGVIFFHKELEFYKQFILQLSETLSDFIVAVFAAFILKSVWALVLGTLAGKFVHCFVSYILHPYKPRFNLELEKMRELFSYGKWISGSSILIFIGAHIDDICVGKFLGATALGFYQMAYKISNMPATEITYVIGRVAFPAYAKIQDQQVSLQNAYFKIMRLTITISIPIAIGIVFLAPDFTRIFLGEKWLPMVNAMQLLAVAGLIKSIVSTGSPLFAGTGHPKFEFYMQLIRGLIVTIVIYPITIHMGISGAAICVILSTLGMLIIWYPFSRIITKASWYKYAIAFGPPLLSSFFMAGGTYLMKLYWNPAQQPLMLAMSIFIAISLMSIVIYMSVMYILQMCHPRFNIVDDIKVIYKSLMGK